MIPVQLNLHPRWNVDSVEVVPHLADSCLRTSSTYRTATSLWSFWMNVVKKIADEVADKAAKKGPDPLRGDQRG